MCNHTILYRIDGRRKIFRVIEETMPPLFYLNLLLGLLMLELTPLNKQDEES